MPVALNYEGEQGDVLGGASGQVLAWLTGTPLILVEEHFLQWVING